MTPARAKALLAEYQEHQRDLVPFALVTGLRQGDVIG